MATTNAETVTVRAAATPERARTNRWGRAPLTAASFAVARIRDKPSRGLVTGLGIAVAVGALFVTSAAPKIAGDATLRRALEAVPAGQRSVTVAFAVNGETVEQLQTMDDQVRDDLRGPGLGDARAQVEYRALAASDGTVFRLAGIERLPETVRVVDGRLPERCDPDHCEVVQIGSADLPLQPELGIDVVGHVELTDTSLLQGQFAPDSTEIIVLGDGVEAVGAIDSLALIGRSIGWVAPIDPTSVRVSDINGVFAAVARTANTFSEESAFIDLPRRSLTDARSRASAAGSRVGLAAAQGVVLLGAFALLAAASARRRHRAGRDLLRQRGATRWSMNVFTLCEAAWPVMIGLLIGVPLGIGATVWLAHRWQLDASDVISEVVASSTVRVLLGALIVLLATAIVMAIVPVSTARPPRKWWRPTAIDAIGIGALLAGLLAIGRGTATPSTLASRGDPIIATLPLLASITVAWLAIRLAPPVIAGFARLLGRRSPLTRTALGEVARRPTIPLVTAGFLAAATMLAVFSLGYRSTLQAGAHDQAAFAVPLDITLTGGSQLVRPSSLEPDGGWSALGPSVEGTEVLRRGVDVRNQFATTDSVTVVGLDPQTIPLLRGWRDDFGPSTASMARAITPPSAVPQVGVPIPADTTNMVVRASGDLETTDVHVIVSRADGTWHEMNTRPSDTDAQLLDVQLTDGDAGGRMIGFRLNQPGDAAKLVEHHIGEGATTVGFFTATVVVHDVDVSSAGGIDGSWTPLGVDLSTLGSDGAVVSHDADGLHIDLRLQGSSALVLPPTPTQISQLPAIVDPATAAAADNGLITIAIPGQSVVTLRVVDVAERFPGAPSRFAIVDRSMAQLAFDLLDPGFGTANEVWLAADHDDEPSLARALRDEPFTELVQQRRASVESRLSSDPLSRFTLGLFGIAALIAAILAIAAVYLSTLSDASEQAPLHRALAAEGVPPRSLSRMVSAASAAIAIVAVVVGAIGALVLLRVVTRVIAVTATSTVPVPPLIVNLRGPQLLVAVVAILVPCLAGAAIAARSARRTARGDLLREFG